MALAGLKGMEQIKDYRVAAVYGSPRRGGNTDGLLNRFLEGLKDCRYFMDENTGEGFGLSIEKIVVPGLNISSCRECRSCSKDGECIIDDDMQHIYPILMGCNLLLVSSPVFFTTVSGYLKAFIDRFQRFWALKYELGKKVINVENRKGILLSCAGSGNENIFDCTKKVMRAFFDVLYIKYCTDFCYNNIDLKGDIFKDPAALDAVYEFSKNGPFIDGRD